MKLEVILSLCERQVLVLIEQGLSSKEIALRFGIRKKIIDLHRQNMMEKLCVKNSIEAIKVAKTLGASYSFSLKIRILDESDYSLF